LEGWAITDIRKTAGEDRWWSLHRDRYFDVAGEERCLSALKREAKGNPKEKDR
jgi:hypothetical protein